jgi:hypothetical protein
MIHCLHCGYEVPKQEDEVEDKDSYFCSTGCVNQFDYHKWVIRVAVRYINDLERV